MIAILFRCRLYRWYTSVLCTNNVGLPLSVSCANVKSTESSKHMKRLIVALSSTFILVFRRMSLERFRTCSKTCTGGRSSRHDKLRAQKLERRQEDVKTDIWWDLRFAHPMRFCRKHLDILTTYEAYRTGHACPLATEIACVLTAAICRHMHGWRVATRHYALSRKIHATAYDIIWLIYRVVDSHGRRRHSKPSDRLLPPINQVYYFSSTLQIAG